MKTSLYVPFWIIKAVPLHLPLYSAIIATTFEQAYDPSPDLYDYAQTKAATMNFVKSLAKQLGPKGIRVNGVAPGPIWTPLQVSGGATQQKLQNFGGQTPLGWPGQPAKLGAIYVQLADSGASYATGQMDGASLWRRPALSQGRRCTVVKEAPALKETRAFSWSASPPEAFAHLAPPARPLTCKERSIRQELRTYTRSASNSYNSRRRRETKCNTSLGTGTISEWRASK